MENTLFFLENITHIIICLFILFFVFVETYLLFLFAYFSYALFDRILNRKTKLDKPDFLSLRIVSQGENGMLKFVLVLPPKGADDVVSRELTYTVGSVGPNMLLVAADANETELLEGHDDEVVVGRLVDVDNAGNRSEPREFKFTLLDTIAPPQPGEVGVRVVSES